jgi:hypothetical protein
VLFASRALRLWAFILILLPLGWWSVLAYLQGEGELAKFLYCFGLVPAWGPLFFAAAFHLHLVIRRYRVSLGAFVLLMLVWGNATAFTWAVEGWQPGVTMGLGLGMLLGFGLTWASSVATFLGVERRFVLACLTALGVLFPPALVITVSSLALLVFALWLRDWSFAVAAGGVFLAAAAAVTWAARLSWRAWKQARQALASACVDLTPPRATP